MGKTARGMRAFVAVAVAFGLAACSDAKDNQPARATTPGPTAVETSATPAGPVSLAITPAPGTGDLPISTEIGTSVTNGKVTEVVLTDSAGKSLPGEPREDGTSWVPAQALQHATAYTVKVTATGGDGKTAVQETTFTTMRKPGGGRVGSGLYMFTGNTYGVGMPVPVEFESDIPAEARDSVQKRLFVKSDPPQVGRWHWFSPRMVLYRPETYWRTGTKITVRTALSGHPIGKRYGDTDRSAVVTIGRKLVMDVDNATKQMNVYKDDALVKTMPVSLGKPKTPSSSGTMVIMSKEEQTVFDTTRTDGPDGYRINIAYAQRITWGGEYLHAAPWSVNDQGVRNVSHGCVNVSTSNAQWLFEQTMIGDPVAVKGTERKLEPGNGWTAWDLPWEQYGK